MNMIQRMEESLVDMLGGGTHLLQIHADDCPPTEVLVEDHGWHEGKRSHFIKITDPSTENLLSVQTVCEHVERTHKVFGKHTVPSATPEEYDALKLSIATFGVRQPIVVDEFGNVIDGRLRLRVCKELGIPCPRITVSKLSTLEKRRLAVDLDVCRKHCGSELRKEVAADILKRSPISSDREVARKCGLDRKKVAEVRETLESGGSIPHLTHRRGKDGKRYKLPKKIPQILTQTDKDARKAQRVLAELGTDAPNKPMELRIAEKNLKRVKRKRAAAKKIAIPKLSDAIKIFHCDFRNLKIEDGSIDLLFTDPPYAKMFLPLWDDLAAFAARVLKPNGLLVTYSGHFYLDQVFASLGKRLTYRWMISTSWGGDRNQIRPLNISSGWKPILVYSKGEWEKRPPWSDTSYGTDKEKQYHDWQQSLEEVLKYVRAFSKPGDLICDPFGGGFTTAKAVQELGDRRFVGCDVEKASVVLGQQRLRIASE
jgi:site-specific DNA-methyltransferase (adenine-specific)